MSQGIDKPINRLVTRFKAKLFTTNTCDYNGRIFRNEREIDGNIVIIPEVFISGKEYKKRTVFSDVKDIGCFFDVEPEREFIDGWYTAKVRICFYANLLKLYSTVLTERATEYVHLDVGNQIKSSEFEVTGLVCGIEAFSDYSLKQNKVDMQPFYVFRFDTEIKYSLNEC